MESRHLELIERVNADRFRSVTSRRGFMKGVAAAGGGLAGLAAMGAVPAFATGEDVGTIINTAATAEALAVTYLGAVVSGAYASASGTDATVKAILNAARAEEQAHYNALVGAGAKPLTTTFTVPSSADPSNKTAALKTIAAAEELFVNAYLSAVATFSGLGKHDLAVTAASILGTECEHRALARAALVLGGDSSYAPPNNWDFEQAPLPSVTAVAGKLKDLGFIGGSGQSASYPGPGTVDPTGVTGTAPPSLAPQAGAPGMPNTGYHLESGVQGALARGIGVTALGGAGAALAALYLGRRKGAGERPE